MITGAHAVVHSTDHDADRAFFRDVLKLTHVDVGDGWLIFGLPPAEVAIHPSEDKQAHELFLMCSDISEFTSQMRSQKIACTDVQDEGWGLLCHVMLPGGGTLGVYEPRHARPPIGPT